MTIRVDQPLEVHLSASAQAVPSARHQVSRWLSRARVPSQVRDEMALVVTELVTNAVEASPGPGSPIYVRGHFAGGPTVVLEVIDQGTGFEFSGSPQLPSPRAVRGRGLPIVDALTDHLMVERQDGQTVVEAARSLRPRDR